MFGTGLALTLSGGAYIRQLSSADDPRFISHHFLGKRFLGNQETL